MPVKTAAKAPRKTRKTAAKATPAPVAVKATRREISPEAVATALEMRSNGAKWSEVIAATGFNGALLRPHMSRLNETPAGIAQRVVDVALTPESIAAARLAGMSWYAISQVLATAEAKVRALGIEGGAPAHGRVYVPATVKTAAKTATKPAAKRKVKAKAATARKAVKPARKGTARTSAGKAAPVTTKRIAKS